MELSSGYVSKSTGFASCRAPDWQPANTEGTPTVMRKFMSVFIKERVGNEETRCLLMSADKLACHVDRDVTVTSLGIEKRGHMLYLIFKMGIVKRSYLTHSTLLIC